MPKYGSKELLIKVTYVAQNPTDWKHVHFGLAKPGSTVGCDFSGIVVKVGKEAVGKCINMFSYCYLKISLTDF